MGSRVPRTAGVVIALLVACGSSDESIDAAPPDAAQADAALADGAPPDALELGPVQCRSSAECVATTGSGCFQSRPGGVCANCGDRGDTCPAGTECIEGGTSGITECAFPCDSDQSCNIGMTCVTRGPIAGYCQPRRCGENQPLCPYPYTFCRETSAPLFECARPLCEDGCPPPLYCPDGGAFCIEP